MVSSSYGTWKLRNSRVNLSTVKYFKKYYPHLTDARLSLKLNVKKGRAEYSVCGRDSIGVWVTGQPAVLPYPASAQEELHRQVQHQFRCDLEKYNDRRAVEYARYYLQQKTVGSSGAESSKSFRFRGSTELYKFARTSDLKDRLHGMEYLVISDVSPVLFGVAADEAWTREPRSAHREAHLRT